MTGRQPAIAGRETLPGHHGLMTAATTVNTLCAYCGVGCGMVLQLHAGDGSDLPVIAKTTGRKDHPTNFGRLCTKGSTTADMLAAPGRMDKASLRTNRGANRESAGLDEVITYTAGRLREIAEEHGPDSIALYVSGQMSIEAQYLATKLAKGYLRTVHIESNSRLCMASAGTGYKQSLGADGPPGSYQDFDHADLFFVTGSNMADCHPILFLRMMDRVRAGAKLVVVDPRRTATAERADLFLQIAPGTDLALLNGLLHLLIEAGAVDARFIAEHTTGFEELRGFLDDYPPNVVARITGVAESDLRRAAEWIGAADDWMSCWTMGLNQSTHGTWNTNALCNLHLATGAICRVGSGPFSLTGQPNAMGGREMGYMGPGLPGQRTVTSRSDREFVEGVWGLPPDTIRTDVGAGTIDMFERMASGQIKACWIICTNPVASVANRATVIEALQRCELVVVQDVFAENETLHYADVALPAALWTESEGVMVNSERNLTLHEAAVAPPGDAIPDWELISRVAAQLGYAEDFDYTCAEEIFEEIKRFWNPQTGWDIRGVSYARLRDRPAQWPCPPGGDTDRHPIRYVNDGRSQTAFTRPDGTRPTLVFPTADGRAVFHARPHLPPAELPDDDYPLLLNTGRLAHQWHTMTKTGRVDTLNKLNPAPFVEIHPEDALAVGVGDGDSVRVSSRRGAAILPAVVTDRVRPGNCFAPFHWSDMFGRDLAINAVTNDAVDPDSLQPEFKACAVALHKVPAPRSAPGPAPGGLAAAFGLSREPEPPALDFTAQQYLTGLLSGLRSAAAAPGVPIIPVDAPMPADVRAWANGVLAGVFSRCDGTETAAATEGRATVDVLWASQTGTVADYAPTVADALRGSGINSRARTLDSTGIGALAAGGTVLIVTSTTGDGDPPDNAAALWKQLATDDAPSLDRLSYAVLAFGDPSYAEFCGFGRKLDTRLSQLGARRIAERVDCGPDFEKSAGAWLDSVSAALQDLPAKGRSSADVPPAPRSASCHTSVPYGRKNPLISRVVRNTRLTKEGSAKDVRQIGFALPEGAMDYQVGDALGVWPRNSPTLVGQFLDLTGLDAEVTLEVGGETMPLCRALRECYDIAKISPGLLEFVAEREPSGKLRALVAPTNQAALEDWTWGRQSVDLLAAYPVRASVDDWLSVLKPLAPRQYSISSSPKVSPREVQLTVSAVRYNVRGLPRHGVCSTYLADDSADEPIGIWVQRSAHFKPPAESDVPMIMVGPGTGIAPFRGFLQERRALGHTGKNWLFFGEQHRATDFYYRDELERFCADGLLTDLDLAFSRDQEHKIYVQGRMLEKGAQLWRWLNDGAHVYVCGDKSRMAKDVDDALKSIIARHGRLSGASAESYLKALAADQRYVRDLY